MRAPCPSTICSSKASGTKISMEYIESLAPVTCRRNLSDLKLGIWGSPQLDQLTPKEIKSEEPSGSNSRSLSYALFLQGRRKSSSEAVHYLPAICPDIVIREARPEDYWEVAETHCSSFFPDHGFPMDLVLRVDRLVAMFSGFSIPPGCRKKCLVASNSNFEENNSLESESYENVEAGLKLPLNGGRVSGILTIDTIAEFLPRRGPLGKRRTGIAYISNVAVRQRRRRRGVARRLVIEAEALAKSWGCRSIALHCDVNNSAAVALYKSQGFRCVKVPEGAKWPHPKTLPGSTFHFMMKLLHVQYS